MLPAERYRQVAAMHAALINQGFLATLGAPFLAEVYRAMDEAEGSVLLVEEADGRVIGFMAGGLGMETIYRRMLRRPVQLALTLMSVFVRPSMISRIVEIFRYGRGGGVDPDLPRAELLSVAVDPGYRGTGVAERLYRRLEKHFARQGIGAFRVTVGESLVGAHRFYRRMGAKPAGRVEVHAGQGSLVYVQDVSASPASGELLKGSLRNL